MTPDDSIQVNPGQTPIENKSTVSESVDQRSLWKKAVAVITILLGILVGFWTGAMITFSACFKSSCSPIEGTAWITIPIATLFFTIPFAKRLNQNEKGALKKIILSSIIIGVIGFIIMWFGPILTSTFSYST